MPSHVRKCENIYQIADAVTHDRKSILPGKGFILKFRFRFSILLSLPGMTGCEGRYTQSPDVCVLLKIYHLLKISSLYL